MAKQFDYPITDTVNDMVACDQMRAEIEASVTITTDLEYDPLGVLCSIETVQFNFVSDLDNAEVVELTALVAAHTGQGIPSPNSLTNLTVATLPTTGTPGDTFYVTDGVGGPGPAYFDGTDWRWYNDKAIVA
jgi:hypothetical protein